MKKTDPKKQSGSKPTNTANSKKKNEKEIEPEIDDSGPHIFEIIKENVKKNYVDLSKREKALLLDYTISIIKPNTISVSKNCRVIIDKIEKANFEIFDFKIKTLVPEEIANLYFKHTNKEYYNDIVEYMTSGPVAILVLINKTDSYIDENGIHTDYLSPILRWKELIGPKDPNIAKGAPVSLRGVYGMDIVRNEFWGSDSSSDAYRELSIFMFPLPARPPVFTFDVNKLSIETIMKFIFPIKPNHPDVSGRLDVFARYGPVLNYHVLDLCICKQCRPEVKLRLKENGKTVKSNKDKIINDDFFNKNNSKFCITCLEHFDKWSHILTGQEQTHIMTNEEIEFMILEMNKCDLIQVLKAEKGSSADTILSKVDLKAPPFEIQYTRKHIEKLFEVAGLDYYDRFDFDELQNLINEDRRIRLNYWVYKIIGKPPSSFQNPKLINNISEDDIKTLKSKNFTLLRTLPIKVKNEEEDKIKSTVIEHPIFIKQKLTDHEINQKVEKLLSKNFCKVSNMEAKNDKSMVNNMILLRNYELENFKQTNNRKLKNNATIHNKSK